MVIGNSGHSHPTKTMSLISYPSPPSKPPTNPKKETQLSRVWNFYLRIENLYIYIGFGNFYVLM
jgi:hypothetical protein